MKRILLLAAAATTLAMIGVGVAAAGGNTTVRSMGDETLKPNVAVRADLRFSPGPISASPGEEITWVGADKPGAPHSVTLTRDPGALVATFSDFALGTCPDCDALIEAAGDAHFAAFPPITRIGFSDGFGDDGDSLLFGGAIPGIPNEHSATLVNVTPGETVFYTCFFHPWMQGTINITK